MKKSSRGFAVVLSLILIVTCISPLTASAAESPIKKEYYGTRSYSGDTVQYKVYKYTYAKRWTPTKVLSGQQAGGYYLKKGDAMYYQDTNSGVSASVSYAGISVSVPLGKRGTKTLV